jgi:hypothetical protein
LVVGFAPRDDGLAEAVGDYRPKVFTRNVAICPRVFALLGQ